MVDALYRGNIEELLSVISHLKKYIIVLLIVLLVLLSIFHFSKYSVHVVPLVTVALVLLPAVYYTTVLVLKFVTGFVESNHTAEAGTMNDDDNRGRRGLKTPDVPYPKSPTPPPSYEEATRNDRDCYRPQSQPSTSGGVFDVQYQYSVAAFSSGTCTTGGGGGRFVTTTTTQTSQTSQNRLTNETRSNPPVATPTAVQNIPSVTITLDNDPLEIQ